MAAENRPSSVRPRGEIQFQRSRRAVLRRTKGARRGRRPSSRRFNGAAPSSCRDWALPWVQRHLAESRSDSLWRTAWEANNACDFIDLQRSRSDSLRRTEATHRFQAVPTVASTEPQRFAAENHRNVCVCANSFAQLQRSRSDSLRRTAHSGAPALNSDAASTKSQRSAAENYIEACAMWERQLLQRGRSASLRRAGMGHERRDGRPGASTKPQRFAAENP